MSHHHEKNPFGQNNAVAVANVLGCLIAASYLCILVQQFLPFGLAEDRRDDSRHKLSCSLVVAPSARSGWSWVESPSEVGVDEERLRKGLQALTSDDNDAAAIFASRCGVAFFASGNTSQPLPVYSIGKTVVTTWAGVLLHRQHWKTLDELLPLSNNPELAGQVCGMRPEWHFDKGSSSSRLRSLRSFLSMTSRFGLDDVATATTVACNQSLSVAAYSNNAVEFLWCLVSKALDAITSNPGDHVSGRRREQDVVNQLWRDHLNGHDDEIHLAHGSQIGGYGPSGGLHLSARDAARLGLLYLQRNGRFGTESNRTVLPPSFVASATSAQVPPGAIVSGELVDDPAWNIASLSVALPYDSNGHANTRMRGAIGYGFGLWILQEGRAFHLSGKFGNYVIVDRNTGFVISILHGDVSSKRNHPNAIDYLLVFRRALTHPLQKKPAGV